MALRRDDLAVDITGFGGLIIISGRIGDGGVLCGRRLWHSNGLFGLYTCAVTCHLLASCEGRRVEDGTSTRSSRKGGLQIDIVTWYPTQAGAGADYCVSPVPVVPVPETSSTTLPSWRCTSS